VELIVFVGLFIKDVASLVEADLCPMSVTTIDGGPNVKVST